MTKSIESGRVAMETEGKGAAGSSAPDPKAIVYHDRCWCCRLNTFIGGHLHPWDNTRG